MNYGRIRWWSKTTARAGLCGAWVSCAALYSASIACAENMEEHWPRDWNSWTYATGDWGGVRNELSDLGFDFSANYTQDTVANPVGGFRQTVANPAWLVGFMDVDFEKLMGADGTGFHFGVYQGMGEDLSETGVGSEFLIGEIFSGSIFGLAQLAFSQRFWGDTLEVSAGRITGGDVFNVIAASQYYVSGGINGNPGQISANLPTYTTAPFNQWGVSAVWRPLTYLSLAGGVYNADENQQNNNETGANFRFNPSEGVLLFAEVGLDVGQPDEMPMMDGRYLLGGYYDSSSYDLLADPSVSRSGNWGLYVMADQRIYREKEDQGLRVWGSFTLAPPQSINTLPFGFNGGLYYKGLLEGRDEDVTAGAFVLSFYSDELKGQSYELVLEANHRLQLNPWLYGTADFQYIHRPSGRQTIPDAWVVGAEISVNF